MKVFITLVSVALAIFSNIAIVHGWTDTGHVVTGEIARRLLKIDTIKELNSLTSAYGDYFPESVSTFPYSTTFMDYIKRDTNMFDSMHFIDYPYEIHNDVKGADPDSTNAVTALKSIGRTLLFGKNSTSETWSKAFSALALLHIVGDMHQPLHAASLFSTQWNYLPPSGDRGGNEFKIQYTSELGKSFNQIHLLYDCIGGLDCEYMPIVMTPEYEKTINRFADSIMEQFPISKYDPEFLYPSNMFQSENKFVNACTAWAKESFEHAKSLYDALTPGMNLNDPANEEFIQNLRTVLQERIAIGGYRLAHILKKANLAKKGPKPYEKEIRFYYYTNIGLGVLFVIAAIVAVVYKHYYVQARSDAYINFTTSVQEVN